MNLTADNTAIVLDSTADLPDAAERFPNWRVVPLYVNFGTESFRDGVDLTAEQFYARLSSSPEMPISRPVPSAARRPCSRRCTSSTIPSIRSGSRDTRRATP